MPAFIEILVSLAMTISALFIHGGKPEVVPPVTPEAASAHGDAVSEAAVNLDPQNTNSQGTNNSENQESSENGEVNAIAELPVTTKIEALNTSSGKTMPTLIPQVAVDNSPALEAVVQLNLSTPEVVSLEETLEVEADENADFGLGLANNHPDAENTDGNAFGEATAENAKNNSHKP